MHESIQTSGSEVSIVIYDAPLPPRYLRFSKRFLRFIFVFIPLCLGILGLSFFFWGLGHRLSVAPKPHLPKVLSEKDAKLQALHSELSSLKESNSLLMEKLSTSGSQESTDDPYLLTIRKPYGMQNLSAQKLVSIDQFSVEQDANKISFKFQIINANAESKVVGYVIAFLLSENALVAYPLEANGQMASGIKYSAGETFAVSRLRPTSADFFIRTSGKEMNFMVYIFSREGDLLLNQKLGPYKVEPKS
jgi:hypothetical protein